MKFEGHFPWFSSQLHFARGRSAFCPYLAKIRSVTAMVHEFFLSVRIIFYVMRAQWAKGYIWRQEIPAFPSLSLSATWTLIFLPFHICHLMWRDDSLEKILIVEKIILEWVAISFSRGSSQPRDWTQVSHIGGRCFNLWTTREPRQEEKGPTKDEIVGWHHWLNGHELEQDLGDGEGQGSLVYCSPWGCKESDATERLNNNI